MSVKVDIMQLYKLLGIQLIFKYIFNFISMIYIVTNSKNHLHQVFKISKMKILSVIFKL